jgi:hypothetical protein
MIGLLTLWIVTIIIFGAVELLPGDIATARLGQAATEESLAILRERFDLNLPLVERCFFVVRRRCDRRFWYLIGEPATDIRTYRAAHREHLFPCSLCRSTCSSYFSRCRYARCALQWVDV